MYADHLHSIQALAAHLPYHLLDTDRANETFATWCRERSAQSLETLDLWTYCFVHRYFLIKFMKDAAYPPADLDELIDTTFKKIAKHRAALPCDTRYASWVSVICKNTFLNYATRRPPLLPLPPTLPAGSPQADPFAPHEPALVTHLVLRAIDRLPPALRDVTRMRLLEQRSYEEIGRRLKRPLPTLRAYLNKALKRLRKDPGLRRLYGKD
ncbi:MAG: DNA-directed RNA polymerase sigma-70 factor [Rhodothermaceae bacterium]|nr:MAG: DNA-directed RNA polymerase sigma-70 factor [Rhodothermaceae bacterium]